MKLNITFHFNKMKMIIICFNECKNKIQRSIELELYFQYYFGLEINKFDKN
jgi:hypothetical protein